MMRVYYVRIDDNESGMNAISLVDCPAVEYDFLKFNKETSTNLSFSIDEDKHIITGVVCLADTPIYRYTEGLGEWYCVFSKETIKQMIAKYSKDNLWNSINLQHDDNKFVQNVYMVESYIKDSARGIVPAEFAEIPDGSWLCSFYVNDDKLWEEIKTSGKLNGFSLQGNFELEEKVPAKTEEEELNDLLKEILS